MEKNLSVADRVIRILFSAVLVFAAIVLFKHPVARVLSGFGALFSLGEAVLGICYLHARLGSARMRDHLSEQALYLVGLVGIQMVLAYERWTAGWEKLSNPEFVSGMIGTLGYFASKNTFPWYKDFLLGFASENAAAFAYAVEWSQISIAVVLAASGALYLYSRHTGIQRIALAASLIALAGGTLMNANFYLAAGWTGPGSHGVNVVMFWIQATLIAAWFYRLVHRDHAT